MILLFLLFIGIIAGVVGSISITDTIRVSFLDIASLISFIYTLFNIRKTIEILKKDQISNSFLLFLLVAFISLILTPLSLTPLELSISFLYIVRILLYFSVYPTLKLLISQGRIKKEDIKKNIILSGLVLSIIGWIQYFLYPDLRNLYYLGWDPHYKRIFSTFLDPNFLGIYLVICLTTIVFNPKLNLLRSFWQSAIWRSDQNLFLKKDSGQAGMTKKHFNEFNVLKCISILLLILTIFFTYSRSSLASLVILGSIYIWKSGKRILFIPIIALFILGLFFLPRPGGEGVKLERVFSISQRLDHARLGLSIFISHPILGIGFDALRYAKAGVENREMWLRSHAGAGLDITLLFILAATGVVGIVFFIRFLYFAFKNVPYNVKLVLGLVLVHSLFENSFFFPFVFLSLFMLFASI